MAIIRQVIYCDQKKTLLKEKTPDSCTLIVMENNWTLCYVYTKKIITDGISLGNR